MNEFKEKSSFVGFITLLAAVLATALYFLLSSITYGLLLAMPSIASLSTVATYFATVGVIGLSCALVLFAIGLIISPFMTAYLHHEEGLDLDLSTSTWVFLLILTNVSLGGAILLSLGFSIPFFISILCGAPAFIISSFLSLSAVNISYLTAASLIVSGFASLVIMFEMSSSVESNEDTHRQGVGKLNRNNLEMTDINSFNVPNTIDSSVNPLLPATGYYDRCMNDIEGSNGPLSAPDVKDDDYRADRYRMDIRELIIGK